jgi:hypothetical protein
MRKDQFLKAAYAALIALTLFISGRAIAPAQQSGTATIEGIVTDPNGAVVPNTIVRVRSKQTGLAREVATDGNGLYRLPLLPPGTYELTAKAQDFAESKSDSLTLTVGQKLNLDIQLSLTTGSETVNITDEAPIVETTRQSVSNSVNDRAVANLPVNGRNFLDFVTLTPGVVRDPRAGDLSFGGQRGTLNSVQIDGVDNNNLFFGQSLGRTGSGRAPYQFSQDAVQEFQVNTNTFSAELGRAAGGVINVVTKSGTNQFHGTGFEFYRDRALNANSLRFDSGLNNFIAGRGEDATQAALIPNGQVFNATTRTITGTPTKPPYHFNQFGGNIGGPIAKDRAFFFFNYDGQRSTTNNIVSFGNTPLATDTAGQAAFANLQRFGETYPRSFNQDVYLGKVDIQVNDDNRLSMRYNRQKFTGVNLENGGATTAQERSGNSLVTTDTFGVTFTTTFSPRLLNELRAQVARDKQPGLANSDNPEAEIRERGQTVIFIGRNNFSPRETSLEKFQLVDNVTMPLGRHNVKAGFDVNIEKIKNFFPGLFGGQYTYNSLADFQNNLPSRFAQNFGGLGTTGALSNPNFNEYSWFIQDDWRLSSNLTVNFGVRYDIQWMRRPLTFNPSPALAAAGIDTSRLDNDLDNVAPRFGFAWRPLAQSDRIVVRGGYGLFYGRTPAIAFGTMHTNNGINVQSVTLNLSPTNRLPFNYPGRFNSIADIPTNLLGAQAPLNIFVFEPDYQQPYTQQGSLGVEAGLTNDIAVNVSYLFVKGSQLSRTRDINLLAPVETTIPVTGTGQVLRFFRHPGTQGNPTRPVAGFGRISLFESSANSQYHGLVFQVRKRLARNYQLEASYTFSKVIDDGPDATSVVPNNAGDDAKQAQYTFNLRDERGPGVADIPHRFVLSAIWELNYFEGMNSAAKAIIGGWQLGGIFQANSNAPFSARIGNVDLNNDSNAASDRAPGFGRNRYRRERFVNLDFRLTKSISVTEQVRLQFIGEFFNILNHVNKTNFDPQIYTVSGLGTANVALASRPQFLTPRGAFDPRIGQLAVKVSF